MYSNYHEIIAEIKTRSLIRISVAVAQDKGVLAAVKLAQEAGIAEAVLVGDTALIEPLMEEVGLSVDTPILHEANSGKAVMQAVSLVKNGQAQVLMKGLVNSSDFLRAVLHKGEGLRTGRLLSHLGAW
ncbi:MAG: Phosphate butyryltransferase [Firmicutes bacterium]|nr:Phosphate butyryltransferase [Bacillota bacterium]